MRDKLIFSCFTACASRASTKSQFKLDISQDSEPPLKKNRKYCVICNQVMQYTVLNKDCLNCIKPEMPVPCINRQQMTKKKINCALLTLKQSSFDIE